MNIGYVIITFLIGLGVSLVLFPPFIRLMVKYRLLDKAGGRKIHTGYTAHMGGIVIYIAGLAAIISMLFISDCVSSNILGKIIGIIVCLTIMLLVGIRDDMHNISPMSKLCFEILVGFVMAYLGVRFESLNGFLGITTIPDFVSYGITICLFIVVVNAFNLIDGVDGQAGLQALNVFAICMVYYILVTKSHLRIKELPSTYFMLILAVATIGSLVGFLRYNWQTASVFMGDAGSLFLGTLITIFIITTSKYVQAYSAYDILHNTHYSSVCGFELKATIAPLLSIFYLPMADTLRVFIARARKGKSPFSADKIHIHHLFIRIGYSHQRCALTTFCLSFCISIVGLLLAFCFDDNICILIIIISWFLYVYLLRKVTKHNIYKIIKSHYKIS